MDLVDQDKAGPPGRNPWQRVTAGSSVPRVGRPAAPRWQLALRLRLTPEDEEAANMLWVDSQVSPNGLGGALFGGLLAVAGLTVVRSSTALEWKQVQPSGAALVASIALVLAFTLLGWLWGAWVIPRLRRALLRRQVCRAYREAGVASTETGEIRLLLDDTGLDWQGPRASRFIGTRLLRGLTEDSRYLLLRDGVFSYVVLPRRELTPDQVAEIRGWMDRHAREGA